ncbi:MAG: DUF4288 domain-containing protein [Gemmataceae bacterium]|nr:DUF4288 domain-containing protein [Gemmataceae bacterium]MCI0740026.1 DUF4288 domain-containing protein [Gemmataceae bacterium]
MWYAVNLLFEGVHQGQPASENLWEERLVLFQADSEEAACRQGESFGPAQDHEYESATGEHIGWRFRRVERVFPIESLVLGDQTELFSRFLRASEVESMSTSFQVTPS